MSMEHTLTQALHYINRAEKKVQTAQHVLRDTTNVDNRIRDYEAMEYALATARQEITAATFIYNDLISSKEKVQWNKN